MSNTDKLQEIKERMNRAIADGAVGYMMSVENISHLISQLEQVQAENERYKGALEWYANEEHYKPDVLNQWGPITLVLEDDGKLAKLALSEVGESSE